MAYKEFTIKDAAGVIHPIRYSTDNRYPPALDAAPVGLRRRAARDQQDIDCEFALQVLDELLDAIGDTNEFKKFQNEAPGRIASRAAPGGENDGNGNSDRGFTPHLKPGGAQDRSLASDAK